MVISPRGSRVSAWLAAGLLIAGAVRPEGRTAGPAAIPFEADLCGSPSAAREFHYRVTGRIRPLIVWTGRRDVGSARVEMATAPGSRRIALLIGTDPARAPKQMNRWGYAAETTCGDRTDVFGLMTQSDESTVDQATVALDEAGAARHYYRAIRSTVDAETTRTETVRLAVAKMFTYRDLRSLMAILPAAGTPKSSARPPGTAPGFLHAVADLLLEGADAKGRAASTYVYGGHVYDLERVSSKPRSDPAYGEMREAEFRTRNRDTKDESTFQITSPNAGDLAGVPVRVVYRPKWWLEVELSLQES